MFAIFVRKRELCASALCCFKEWATTNLLTSKFRRFASLREGRMSPAVLAQVWWLKSGSLPPLSLATDASMVRKHCWLLEGKATQQIEQQIENRSNNCILGTIIIRSLDTPSWQEIQVKPPEVRRRGRGQLGTRLNSTCLANVSLVGISTLVFFSLWDEY